MCSWWWLTENKNFNRIKLMQKGIFTVQFVEWIADVKLASVVGDRLVQVAVSHLTETKKTHKNRWFYVKIRWLPRTNGCWWSKHDFNQSIFVINERDNGSILKSVKQRSLSHRNPPMMNCLTKIVNHHWNFLFLLENFLRTINKPCRIKDDFH